MSSGAAKSLTRSERIAARTALCMGLLSQLLIDAQQQEKELGVLQKKVGHWGGLMVW